MTRFATALAAWMDARHPSLSVRRLAELAQVNSGDLTRIRNGDKTITTSVAAKLLPAISEHFSYQEAEPLAIAYLEDKIPPGFADRITVTAGDSLTIVLNSGHFSAALRWIHQRGASDGEFAHWIMSLHRMMDPQAAAAWNEEDERASQQAHEKAQQEQAELGNVTPLYPDASEERAPRASGSVPALRVENRCKS